MIKILLKIGWWAESRTSKLTRKGLDLVGKMFYKLVKLICISGIEIICFVCFKVLRINPKSLVDDGIAPVVSLTSFPARINSVWLVLLSMFLQTYRPAKILLVLTEEEFPNGKSMLPSSLLRFEKLGVEIVFQSFNLKPHNKYFYALSHVKDRLVVTIDDDLYYWSDTIERLYKLKSNYPHSICANRTMRIVNEKGLITYQAVNYSENNIMGHSLMAQGFSGILYPPEFRTKEMFNDNTIKEYSLNNDDNWLKIQELLVNIPVVTGQYYPHPLVLLQSQRYALFHKNMENNQSAQVTQNLLEYYHIINLISNK